MSNPVVVHSKLSFSGRERWAKCPASVALSAGMSDKTSPAAAEGSCAHLVGEWWIRSHAPHFGLQAPGGSKPPLQRVPEGLDLKGRSSTEWNDEMSRHGRAYAEFVLSLIPQGEEAYISIEQRVAAPSIHEHLFGTADCLIWLPGLKRLIVVDYKYGFAAVEIGEFDATGAPIAINPQLAAYAVAAAEQARIEPEGGITLAVFQPRRPSGSPEQTLALPYEWLKAERAALAKEAAAVDAATAGVENWLEFGGIAILHTEAGPHCRYCKGKTRCPELQNALQTGLQVHGGLRDLRDIPKDELIALWAAKTAFKAFWEDIEELVQTEARSGNPRLTVKETKGRQMWADPSAATLALMALGKPELLSPCALSEALPHLPEQWKSDLIKRSAPSRSIRLVDENTPSQLALTFAKYAKSS